MYKSKAAVIFLIICMISSFTVSAQNAESGNESIVFYGNDGGANVVTYLKTSDNIQRNIFDENIVCGEGSSIKFSFENAVAGEQAMISRRSAIDISDLAQNGYIRLFIYADADSNELYPELSMMDRSLNKSESVPLYDLMLGEWNEITLKLSNFGQDIDYTKILRLVLSFPEDCEQKYDMYIGNIEFYKNTSIEIETCSAENGLLNLSWYDGTEKAEYYRIICNDEVLDTVYETVYECSAPYGDGVNTYKIEAYDDNGELISTSAPAYLPLLDELMLNEGSLYTAGGESEAALTDASFSHKQVLYDGKSIAVNFEERGAVSSVTSKKTVDISQISKTGYFKFFVYAEGESDTFDGIVRLEDSEGTVSDNASFSVNTNGWSLIKIRLSDLISDNFNAKKVYGVSLESASDSTARLYIQQLCFYNYEKPELISASANNDNSVTIEWTQNSSVSQYGVYCDDTEIARVDGDVFQYIHENPSLDVMHTYYVISYSSDGEALAVSNTLSVTVEDIFLAPVIDLYTNTDNTGSAFPYLMNVNSSYYGFSTKHADTSPLGGNSIFFRLEGLPVTPVMVESRKIYDITDIYDEGYVKCYVYVETDLENPPELMANLRDRSYQRTSYVPFPDDFKYNTWQLVKFKLSDFLPEDADIKRILRWECTLTEPANGEFNIYVQNIRFFKKLHQPEATVTGSGIDESGNSFADVVFSEEMNAQTFLPENFEIEGINCIGARLNADKKTARLIFDKAFEFPKQYILQISRNVISANGLSVLNRNTEFTTTASHDNISVKSIFLNKDNISAGELILNADVTSIFSNDGSPQDITMLAVVYEDNKIINTVYDEKHSVSVKHSESFSCSINIDNAAEGKNYKVCVYFIDNINSAKPLCGKYDINI